MKDWGEPPIDFENNRPAELGVDMPRSVYLNTNWIIAIDAWDYCDPSLLTEMIKRHPIPFELQHVIAEIISGSRKQNRKAAAKLKIPAGHRMIYAGLYAELKSVIDGPLERSNAVMIDGKVFSDYHVMAEDRGLEIEEMRRAIQASGRRFKHRWASIAGVSVETLDNIYGDLKRKIKNYPHI